MQLPKQNAKHQAIKIIADRGGTIRTAEAIAAGIHPQTLYSLRDTGNLEQISRGLFRLAKLEPISNPDLVTMVLRIPRATVCLVSALAFHGITTQIPHEVSIALEKGSRRTSPGVSAHPGLSFLSGTSAGRGGDSYRRRCPSANLLG